MNWVEAEVRVALSRVNTDESFLFIPTLAPESAGSSALPPFAKLYQGVRDPLGDGKELAKLLKAVLRADWDKSIRLIDEPFVGLRSMREEEADRFFGRNAEIAELVEKFRRHRIVAIVADSGTGKSSLAEAGLAPAFRGGALADPMREEARDKVWQVVTMRPRADPVEGLRQGVEIATQKLGRSLADVASLRDSVSLADADETAFALQCGLPPHKTTTLLIVDQFEELFTETPAALAAPFVKLLLDLAEGDKDVRVLLTMRADYFNLLSDIKDAAGETIRGSDGKTLFDRLNAEGGDAILRLKRISQDGLADAVRKPLMLAGEADRAACDALLKAVRQDISDQPSDLPLLQVALRAAWQEHKATRRPMLEAYQSVGGVRGALANEAEKVRKALPANDQARLPSIFVRLVRLGDTGGATRRTAPLDEFDAARQALLRRLGADEYGRLVSVAETTAEIAHEGLITQWPWLQGRLRDDARDVRRLDRMMSRSREWSQAPADSKLEYLAAGAEREIFDELAKRRADWLSPIDTAFVAASHTLYQAEFDARQVEEARRIADAQALADALRTAQRTNVAPVVTTLLVIAAGVFGYFVGIESTIAKPTAHLTVPLMVSIGAGLVALAWTLVVLLLYWRDPGRLVKWLEMLPDPLAGSEAASVLDKVTFGAYAVLNLTARGSLLFLGTRPAALEAWVRERRLVASDLFNGKASVRDRRIALDLPIRIGGTRYEEPWSELGRLLSRRSPMAMLISGPGGTRQDNPCLPDRQASARR
jgi:hypothetical protein